LFPVSKLEVLDSKLEVLDSKLEVLDSRLDPRSFRVSRIEDRNGPRARHPNFNG